MGAFDTWLINTFIHLLHRVAFWHFVYNRKILEVMKFQVHSPYGTRDTGEKRRGGKFTPSLKLRPKMLEFCVWVFYNPLILRDRQIAMKETSGACYFRMDMSEHAPIRPDESIVWYSIVFTGLVSDFDFMDVDKNH